MGEAEPRTPWEGPIDLRRAEPCREAAPDARPSGSSAKQKAEECRCPANHPGAARQEDVQRRVVTRQSPRWGMVDGNLLADRAQSLASVSFPLLL